MEENRQPKQLREDSQLNSTLSELAELPADIATKDENLVGEAIKDLPNDSTQAVDEAPVG